MLWKRGGMLREMLKETIMLMQALMVKLGFITAEKNTRPVNVLLYHSGVLHLNRFVV